jgi:hypothetical protein
MESIFKAPNLSQKMPLDPNFDTFFPDTSSQLSIMMQKLDSYNKNKGSYIEFGKSFKAF